MTTIRPEIPDDLSMIYEIIFLAFGGTGEADLVNRIRNSPQFIPELSLVAEIDGHLVGHILFSKITIENDGKEMECLGLAPLAVHPAWQRKGIGSQLVQIGLKTCVNNGHGLVIVLGHPEFYPRFGFIPASRKGIFAPFDVPDEAFMTYEGIPGTWNWPKGRVKYPATFDGLD
jgi:putative acetyltransferase